MCKTRYFYPLTEPVRFLDSGRIEVEYTAKIKTEKLRKLISSFTGYPVQLKNSADNMEDIIISYPAPVQRKKKLRQLLTTQIFILSLYVIMSVDMEDIVIPQRYKSIIDKISITAVENSFDVYIVGGFVRDLFIKREPKDLDIMVCGRGSNLSMQSAGINFSKILAKKYKLDKPVIFERFGTSKLFMDSEEVEFVMPRREYYNANSRNPDTQIASVEQDALRRDFTINALFLRLNDMKILDFTSQGVVDIKNKIIRVTDPSNIEIIFKQDPLRILRAVRQSVQLDFKIETETYNAMKISSPSIEIVSPERIRDEINKILIEKIPSKAFKIMDEINLSVKILPEVARLKNLEQLEKYHTDDVFVHTLKVLDRTKNDIILRMAALLHDTGKYATCKKNGGRICFYGHDAESAKEAEAVLKRLKYSKEFIQKTVSVIKNHMYPKMYSDDWTDGAVRRFVKRCSGELDLIMEISRADYGKDSNDVKLVKLKKRIEDLKLKNMLYPKPELLTGREMMRIFNRLSGKWIRKAKSKIEEMRFENPGITKEEAIEIIREMFRK
ncbi:CCA tRNA nucleotidyltransferase [Candidatus Endomicrobiellum trichonymphae]|nr:HD domain-containing protein [Candidatus Endomicrobium trichonymphae]